LIRNIINISSSYPIRIWIIDNSGSMQTRDAHHTRGHCQRGLTMVDCTRWEEVQDCVYFQADIAGILGLRSEFTMINDLGNNLGPSKFSIRGFNGNIQHPNDISQDVQTAKSIMARAYPTGATPLTQHILQIQRIIAPMAQELKRTGKLATVILITDGLPSDAYGNEGTIITQKFIQALKTLENLPVWLVIRLCTDDDSVVDFYNNLDAHLNNLDIDVVDDYYGEAIEVFLRNPWLNYALPLHRFREIGFRVDIFDAIDERPLTLNEIGQLCSLLFSGHTQGGLVSLPDPNVNLVAFLNAVSLVMNKELPQWNPVHKKLSPWIDLQRLHFNYASDHTNAPPLPIHSTNEATTKKDIHNSHAFGHSKTATISNDVPTITGSHLGRSKKKEQQYNTQSTPSHEMRNTHDPKLAINANTLNGSTSFNQEELKRHILIEWALNPPSYKSLRSIAQLVSSLNVTFPPAFGLKSHEYFRKWKPFSAGALETGDEAVLKKAVRKTKVFLHPDKRPNDLSPNLEFLFKMLWDVISDAWEIHQQ